MVMSYVLLLLKQSLALYQGGSAKGEAMGRVLIRIFLLGAIVSAIVYFATWPGTEFIGVSQRCWSAPEYCQPVVRPEQRQERPRGPEPYDCTLTALGFGLIGLIIGLLLGRLITREIALTAIRAGVETDIAAAVAAARLANQPHAALALQDVRSLVLARIPPRIRG
jgi:hypothetical protein